MSENGDLQGIKDDMAKFKQGKYKMIKDPYENDIGMQVVRANREGNIAFLQQASDAGLFDPLEITEVEKWNYLHRANLLNPSPVSTIRFYLDKGVAVNAQDCYGMTPLHYAMREENAEVALVLLEAGADPNIPNCDNIIPLAMIGRMPHRLDLLEQLLKSGGNVHYLNGNNDIDVLEFLQTYRSEEEEFKPIIHLMEQYA